MISKLIRVLALVFLIFQISCSSQPKSNAPEWARGPTRVIDNGYIVYLGQAGAPTEDRARFKAEGIALEDLANECSMIPLGTRVEDRFTEKEKYDFTAYVKIAVEFQECEGAKSALTPESVRKIANVPFTQQLKRYQDFAETGDIPSPENGAREIEPPTEIASAPAREPRWTPRVHFFVTRQYVAYQKEIVILSPPTAFPPASPAATKFYSAVQPATEQIHKSEVAEPALRSEPWSRVADRPHLPRPGTLAAPLKRTESLKPPPPARHVVPHPANPKARRGGKRINRRWHAEGT